MGSLHLIFGDQLSHSISSLGDFDPSLDTVFMCECLDEMTRVKHHKKKIAFQIAAMRHFARELEDLGTSVKYISLDDPQNTGSLEGEIERFLRKSSWNGIVLTKPSEYHLLRKVEQWQEKFGIPVEMRKR